MNLLFFLYSPDFFLFLVFFNFFGFYLFYHYFKFFHLFLKIIVLCISVITKFLINFFSCISSRHFFR
ncbi:hypothetical protein C1646_681885 [Rhizophagus diaphanus]|nr:hypothetical protein C1646_681885 [Rhizophagus diaphanus] [Rhizophagus sp. MUCL 43196]